jgi:hypothetical protein
MCKDLALEDETKEWDESGARYDFHLPTTKKNKEELCVNSSKNK